MASSNGHRSVQCCRTGEFFTTYNKELPQLPHTPSITSTYNILLLGQTQAGKSTFLQAVRRYANPNCEVDFGSIGSGNSSHTTDVRTATVETNFPEYRLFDTSAPNRLNPMQYMHVPFQSQDGPVEKEVTFTDLFSGPTLPMHRRRLNREDYSLNPERHSYFHNSNVRIFDTPGLNDTNGHDERNVTKILSALSGAGAVHLILIMIAGGPLTPELQSSLKTYSRIFSAMGGLLVFVHTNMRFDDQHPNNPRLTAFINERRSSLRDIMGRDIPHFFIDCDLDEDRPAHLYCRQRIIRHLLLIARMNEPVPLSNMQLYKTQKMIEVDELIAKEYRAKQAAVEKEMSQADKRVREIDIRVNITRYNIREVEEIIRNYNTENLELIHEDRFDEDWRLFSFRQEAELTAANLEYTIDVVHVDEFGIETKGTEGGVGHRNWSVRLIRQSFKYGTYHVKLYIKRCNKYAQEIKNWKRTLESQRTVLESELQERNSLVSTDGGESGVRTQRQQLMEKHNQCLDMIARASRSTLHLDLFKALGEAGVYEGRLVDCMQKATEFYSNYVPGEGEEVSLMAI
ncbi:hypothetical protein BC939DRAFT_435949 [Gamsiella multidivaricata]|uniref:uncharacterized protein n=1 Tax=Gamsiella multidivaricata TaxID=101098 RepID=UPI00221F255D|nr:uncharacterized protein BC939DRAFT_435949 [Gamsiella multidivaricata]KAI7831667.1 hypothetical protein BC939DRAFT_435949 [Gamsiella multidivaricata]